ncbi:MAG TPA: hypothetical protein VD994_21600, partial [Prosthecobacter sp.]|nr:hypothetical protein [Prosthecobacter sp.]
KYLAVSAAKGIASGLPETGTVGLRFTDAGLSEATLDPDVAAFNYTASKTVVMPKAGGSENPAKATLSLNKATGLVGGSFTLVEPSPLLSRRVIFQGMIVRPATGNSKAVGYFLLPQIPLTVETISTSPILSGKVIVEQTPVAE